MTGLEDHAEGVVLAVAARGGARRNTLATAPDGRLRVTVTPAPERGKANQAIVALLARELGVKKSAIELLGGRTASQKRLLIRGVNRVEMATRIDQALARQ